MSSSVQTEGEQIRLATHSSKMSLRAVAVPDMIIVPMCAVCGSVSIPVPVTTMSAWSSAHTENHRNRC